MHLYINHTLQKMDTNLPLASDRPLIKTLTHFFCLFVCFTFTSEWKLLSPNMSWRKALSSGRLTWGCSWEGRAANSSYRPADGGKGNSGSESRWELQLHPCKEIKKSRSQMNICSLSSSILMICERKEDLNTDWRDTLDISKDTHSCLYWNIKVTYNHFPETYVD